MRTSGLVALLSLAACGSDSATGDRLSVNTGLPRGQPLMDLDDQDRSQFCEALVEVWGAIDIEEWCTFGVFLIADIENRSISATDCEMIVADCTASGSPIQDVDACRDATADIFDSCEATVGDYESCYEYRIRALVAAFSGLRCEDAGSRLVDERLDAYTSSAASQPESCDVLDACVDIDAGE